MPATAARPRSATQHRLRVVAFATALLFLCSVGASAPEPAEATNWSRQIGALRAGQIAYESMMRAADREVRSLKRARKQAGRKLKKAHRRLDAATERRATRKARLIGTRTQVRVARAALAAASMETPPPPDTEAAVEALREAIDPTLRAERDTAPADVGSTPPVRAFVGATRPAGAPPSPVDAGVRTTPFQSGPRTAVAADVSVADVVKLERKLKRDKRAFRKAQRQVRRSSRNVNATRRSLRSLKARKRGAIARREGAEAALAGRILAMSTLAQRRAAKKTKVRPGRNSGFVWPARGRLSQTYGCTGFRLNPPRGSCRHFHDGLDIAGYRGSPIRAAAVGVVSYIGWNPWDQHGRAFMIVVAHPGGYETLYGHVLPTRKVRVGQLVRKNEIIGYMGNTGRSTGVHLHFEVRRGRTTLNPLAFL